MKTRRTSTRQVKFFEVRDRATFIPVCAVRIAPRGQGDRYIINMASMVHGRFIYLISLVKDESHWDPNKWEGRTYKAAHQFIIDNWFSLSTGAVVDVEFALGETKRPKRSQRFTG